MKITSPLLKSTLFHKDGKESDTNEDVIPLLAIDA